MWHLRYQRILWSFGTNKETARASNCHPWRNTNIGGFDLLASVVEVVEGDSGGILATVGDPAESHANKDCEAHNNIC